MRRIYKSTNYWRDGSNAEIYQITNEYDFLATEENEWYFVIALFGIEFAINIGGISIDGYKKWLMEHDLLFGNGVMIKLRTFMLLSLKNILS